MTTKGEKPYRLSGAILATLLWVFSWSPPSADGGWRIVATTASLSAASATENLPQIVTSIAKNKVKYETRVWTQIVDLKTQRLFVLNHFNQTYWQGSIDEYVAAMSKRAAEVRARMDKVIQRIPPEQRLMLEKKGGPFETISPNLTITITRSSEQERVAGYEAHKYQIARNGEPYEDTWIAGKIDLSTEVNMRRLQEFIGKLQASRTSPPGAVLAELTKLIAQGYPVKTVNLFSNLTKEVILAERTNIPDRELAIPPDYSQRTLTDLMSPRKATLASPFQVLS
jgi:Domain of unknown function (DUF4412)